MINTLALGSLLLAVCGIPQFVKVVREKHCDGLSYGFVFLWWGGELLVTWSLLESGLSNELLINYIPNVGITSVILWYKLFGKRTVSLNSTIQS